MVLLDVCLSVVYFEPTSKRCREA